jgi:hypothetical protein
MLGTEHPMSLARRGEPWKSERSMLGFRYHL